MKCAICKETIDIEHPETIRGHNPETFRIAWFHWFCYQHTYDELENKPAKQPYLHKQDEYDTRFN